MLRHGRKVAFCRVQTHTMPRAALKLCVLTLFTVRIEAPTHTMLRAALKLVAERVDDLDNLSRHT